MRIENVNVDKSYVILNVEHLIVYTSCVIMRLESVAVDKSNVIARTVDVTVNRSYVVMRIESATVQVIRIRYKNRTRSCLTVIRYNENRKRNC